MEKGVWQYVGSREWGKGLDWWLRPKRHSSIFVTASRDDEAKRLWEKEQKKWVNYVGGQPHVGGLQVERKFMKESEEEL